jgi:transposase
MFGDFTNSRIYLKTGKTDFRKSVNGLSILVEETMKTSVTGGDLFVFCNRGKNRLKILYYDRNGFCLWYKRLEEDKFRWPKNAEDVLELTREELNWLLRGLDFRSAHRERRYASVT